MCIIEEDVSCDSPGCKLDADSTGYCADYPACAEDCKRCNGKGHIREYPCFKCNGTGKRPH